ncbi:hypothetical protein LCI18_006330 [Fusarium solani-melongenae]|uniref:Uncharacterized protein n=1 Tax=Fusarium solani subsp. cucurbitae TaxID=2747967 RepID=A0ACD3Z2Q5_FUSSC|nr:hypothetical protein LCI18_006330 [Fusarium solani-melongenae]
MVKTYILAPNQTTAPNDLIRLGHLLDDITDIREFEPLNPDDIVPIDKTRTNFKIGFTSSRQKLISGEFGVFAKILGLIGLGAGARVYDGKDKDSILSCKILETQTFSPNKAYIEKCMKLPDVDNFMQGAKYKAPVYLVTGLKIGRGASFQSGSSISRGAALEAGISVPGAPVEIGPSAGVHLTRAEGESWEGSTDFVVAYRVKRIQYRQGEIEVKTNTTKAVMQDGSATHQGPAMSLDISDDVPMSEITTRAILAKEKDLEGEVNDEEPEEVYWVVPGS